jgi:hypothetical protein
MPRCLGRLSNRHLSPFPAFMALKGPTPPNPISASFAFTTRECSGRCSVSQGSVPGPDELWHRIPCAGEPMAHCGNESGAVRGRGGWRRQRQSAHVKGCYWLESRRGTTTSLRSCSVPLQARRPYLHTNDTKLGYLVLSIASYDGSLCRLFV